MIIGICDNSAEIRNSIQRLCEQHFEKKVIKQEYILFSNGKEVLAYCGGNKERRIDVLIIDAEARCISEIELMDSIKTLEKVWKFEIDARGKKRIGFIHNSSLAGSAEKKTSAATNEIKEDDIITIKGLDGKRMKVELADILYFKASGSYTEIYTYSLIKEKDNYILSTKKIGEIEEKLKQYPIVRVHKSYMVNVENVTDIGTYITLNGADEKIPIGRAYKDNVRCRCYGHEKDKRRKSL